MVRLDGSLSHGEDGLVVYAFFQSSFSSGASVLPPSFGPAWPKLRPARYAPSLP